MAPSIPSVRITVVAVGRLRPPFVDDVAHYAKLLGRYARLELIEVREERRGRRAHPGARFVSLLDVGGGARLHSGVSEFLDAPRQSAATSVS